MNSVTFSGSLGDLVRTLRELAKTHVEIHLKTSPLEEEAVVKYCPQLREIFPQIGNLFLLRTYSDNFNVLLYPNRKGITPELLRREVERNSLPLFEEKVSDFYQLYKLLSYDRTENEIKGEEKILSKFYRKLREIRPRMRLSRSPEFYIKDIVSAVRYYSTFFPNWFKDWETEDLRPDQVDKLIAKIAGQLELNRYGFGRPSKGRPPKPFNALLFHVINQFIEPLLVWKRVGENGETGTPQCELVWPQDAPVPQGFREWKLAYVGKDGKLKFFKETFKPLKSQWERPWMCQLREKIRFRKNWQSVCAALLWLHVIEGIPEMERFIERHKKEDVNATLKKFVSWAKREYSHFLSSRKGIGKYGPASPYKSHFLGISKVFKVNNNYIFFFQ